MYEAWVFQLIVFVCLFWRIQFNNTTLAEGKEEESGDLEKKTEEWLTRETVSTGPPIHQSQIFYSSGYYGVGWTPPSVET